MQTQWIFKPLTTMLLAGLSLLMSCAKDDATIPVDEAFIPPSNLTERVIIDTAYGTELKQNMDLYLPAGRNAATKLIVMIHGGNWSDGDKSEMDRWVSLLRLKLPQAAIANINYRMVNGKSITYNQLMNDVHTAVTFLTKNKAVFNISDKLALWGAGAGAQLALQYTYTKNNDGVVKCAVDMFGPSLIADWEWYNKIIPLNTKKALIKMSGSGWNAPLYKMLSPYHTASAASKPTIIFHGNLDAVIPVYQSQSLHSKLKELNVPVEYYEYTDFHGFTFESNDTDRVVKTISFFEKYLR